MRLPLRKLRLYGLLAILGVLGVFVVTNIDLNTVEWVLRGAPAVEGEKPAGRITVLGEEFSLQDYRQLLRRDAILPIYDPEFVTAEEASFSDEELVLGVAINGESRAYPVGVLTYREMVIDEVGGVPLLVTW